MQKHISFLDTRKHLITTIQKRLPGSLFAMAPQFRWPFSMRYLHTMDEFRPLPSSLSTVANSKQSDRHRTFRLPFSLEYLYTMDEFRPLVASEPPVPIAADVTSSPRVTSPVCVGTEDLTPSATRPEAVNSSCVESDDSDEDSEVSTFPMYNEMLDPSANSKVWY
jgi:hypothetical protein